MHSCVLISAENYSQDLERYRKEMRDARDQIGDLRVALRQGRPDDSVRRIFRVCLDDEENRETKRSTDQLATDFERATVATAIENHQLL